MGLFNTSMRDNDQTYMGSLFDTIRFVYLRGSGHHLRYLTNRIRWYVYPRFGLLPKFPDHVDIETCSSCNMKCPMCFTITDQYKQNVKLTVMDFDLYKRIVDECVDNGAFSIRLSWRGEPTLNPRFVDMVAYAKERGVREVSTLTNALRMTPAMFEKLVDLKLDWLTISFDGMGETYNRIRAPAKFDEAVAKIREFHQIKVRKRRKKPVVKVQGIWPAVKEDPQGFYDTFNDITDQVAVNPLLDYLREDDAEAIVYRERFTCPVLWQRLAIGADGLVSLCIHDELSHHITGDVKTTSIRDIWNGAELTEARERHRRHEGIEHYAACQECFLPREEKPVTSEVSGRTISVKSMVNHPDSVGQSARYRPEKAAQSIEGE